MWNRKDDVCLVCCMNFDPFFNVSPTVLEEWNNNLLKYSLKKTDIFKPSMSTQ